MRTIEEPKTATNSETKNMSGTIQSATKSSCLGTNLGKMKVLKQPFPLAAADFF